jgi:hypothetical protein
LTAFAGLVLIQQLFSLLNLKHRLHCCFEHLARGQILPPHRVFLQLVVQLRLGFRRLSEPGYAPHAPMVQRRPGLNDLPDAAPLSRQLQRVDEKSLGRLHQLLRNLALERLTLLIPARGTIDFDGLGQSTGRRAEGVAVGYNPRRKGQRSDDPLWATLAQTAGGRIFSIEAAPCTTATARAFILACIRRVRAQWPHGLIEVRTDGAFFSDEIAQTLSGMGFAFTIAGPFERFPTLKPRIENRGGWRWFRDAQNGFEAWWKPRSWHGRHRFLFIRQERAVQRKDPVQLDLFEPIETPYDDKLVVRNKPTQMKHVLQFHEGRGQQANRFGQRSSQCPMQHGPRGSG